MDSWSEETNPPSEDVGFYPARLNKAPRAASFLASVLLHYIFLFGPPCPTLVTLYISLRGDKNCDLLSSISFLFSITWGPLMLYTSFPLILAINLLIMQVATWVPIPSAAFFNLLWVAANKVVLFRGHFLINAARSSAVGIYYGGDSLS